MILLRQLEESLYYVYTGIFYSLYKKRGPSRERQGPIQIKEFVKLTNIKAPCHNCIHIISGSQ